MSFIYPRLCSISRASITKSTADGLHQDHLVIGQDIECSIQLKRPRSGNAMAYPAPTAADDAVPTWMLYIPLGALEKGLIEKGDQVLDDEAVAYVVEAPYWNSLGYNIEMKVYHP